MADDNPYAQYRAPAANPYAQYGLPAGTIQVAPPTPGYGNLQPKSDEELRAIRLANQRAAAQAPHDAQNADADATLKQLQVRKATQDAADADAARTAASMGPTSQVHGDDYLRKYVPPAMWDTVKAYARGDIGSRTGVSKSMLPILQHAMNYDPSTSGTTFPARVKMQSQLADSNPASIGGSLRSMEQMLLHGSDVLDQAHALDNWHSGLTAPFNYAKTVRERIGQDPRLSGFNKSVENYAPESQKAIAGVAGGVNERGDRAASLSANMSPEAVAAALQSDARMALDRIGAVNDQYRRVMGRDITDQLSPAAKAAYDKIMAGGYDPKGKPLAPAAGWTPISGGASNGTSFLGGGGGGGGNGPSGGVSGGGQYNIATGPTRSVVDPSKSPAVAALQALLNSNASDEAISTAATGLGASAQSIHDALIARHSGGRIAYNLDALGKKDVPTTFMQQAMGSPIGTALGATADAALGGTSDEIASLLGGGDLADLNARKQAAFAANPGSALAGQVLGTGLAMYGIGKFMPGGLASRFANPQLAGDIAFSAASGAGQDNDNRLLGTGVGAIGGVVGGGIGQGVARGVGAVARTAPVQRLGRMMFNGLPTPAAPLGAGEQMAMDGVNRAGLSNVTDQLSAARDLGVPMTLADTAPGLRTLGGAAVRRSPNAAQIAENALIPRSRGQVDRFGQAVARDLGPVANVPQLSADLAQQARTASAPLYDNFYGQPTATSPELQSLLNTPAGRKAAGFAQTIAANERQNPQALGFNVGPDGRAILKPSGAVDAPPLDEAGRFQSDLGSFKDQVVTSTRGALPPAPKSLLQWVRSQGGVSSSSMGAGDLRFSGMGSKGAPGLIHSKGQNLDDLLTGAKEVGYMPDHADLPDFLDALDNEHRGISRLVRPEDVDAENAYQQAGSRRDFWNGHLAQIGKNPATMTDSDWLDLYGQAHSNAGRNPNPSFFDTSKPAEPLSPPLSSYGADANLEPDPYGSAMHTGYTPRSLQYIKHGLDNVVEGYRDTTTGKLNLTPQGMAENGVRSQFVNEVDRLYPTSYPQARAAYAGPMQARNALVQGQNAYRMTPDELGMQVAGQSPEHLAQMRLGDRSQLVDSARSLRDATNPFDAASTLGTPAARARLALLHGGAPATNVDQLFRQADMERGLARTNNKILGNSDTAERSLADKAFGIGSWAVPAAIDAGLMTFGHVPVATAARVMASHAGRDAFTMGLGRRAVAKADQLAPLLFNPDPAANLSALGDAQGRLSAWQDYVARTTPSRPLRMFGSAFGSQAAVAPLTYRAAP